LIAFIAALSLASLPNAAALLAIRASLAALRAAFWNEFALFAKSANAVAFLLIEASTSGCEASAFIAAEWPEIVPMMAAFASCDLGAQDDAL
jgi:hypothetical protein